MRHHAPVQLATEVCTCHEAPLILVSRMEWCQDLQFKPQASLGGVCHASVVLLDPVGLGKPSGTILAIAMILQQGLAAPKQHQLAHGRGMVLTMPSWIPEGAPCRCEQKCRHLNCIKNYLPCYAPPLVLRRICLCVSLMFA